MANQAATASGKKPIGKRNLFIGFLFIGTMGGFLELVQGETAQFADPAVRVPLCIGFLMWAWVYYKVSKTPVSILFGLIKIAAALWSDWFQLGKIAQEGLHSQTYDRVLFVAAGLAVLASGIKDIAEGLKALSPSKISATTIPIGNTAPPGL
jgi:hypothetical protein